MKPFLKLIGSLELTIACLALGMVVIFFGTLDQVNLGIHVAAEKYFYSILVLQRIEPLGISVPYMPGGYLIGFVLLVNLVAASTYRFKFTAAKIGIWFIHVGVILLLIGEFVSSVFQEESSMTIDEGATSNYIESFRIPELAIIDTTDPEKDRVYSIPEAMLERLQQVRVDELPFVVSIDQYMPNSTLHRRDAQSRPGMRMATQGLGREVVAFEIPPTGKPDERNLPAVVFTLFAQKPSATAPEVIGTWLTREFMPPQTFEYEGRSYAIQTRRKREYLPYQITLNDFIHDKYLGTNTPKDFASEITLKNEITGEERDFRIFMNNPLRYDGLTFYQQGFLNDDKTSILQVVRNPGRHLPYISCSILSLGLFIQFGYSLTRFVQKSAKPAKSA